MLNVTPDSFSDGGAYVDTRAALAHAEQMIARGADVVDVGGESSRPAGRVYGAGAETVSSSEEQRRVLPVIEALVAQGIRVSIDTVKADVARAAVKAGAAIVNDVSCGRGEALLRAVADSGAELVLMHNRGRGECSGNNVVYRDVVQEVRTELLEAVERAARAGVRRDVVWIDPGIGFAKTSRQSAALLAHTDVLVATGQRVLVGPSRKSFIAELVPELNGDTPGPHARAFGTAASVALAVFQGAHAVRVHDVAEMRQAVRLAGQLREARA